MELKDFIKNVLIDLNEGVDQARQLTSRNITFSDKDNTRTIEFDIAVSVEASENAAGSANVRVLKFAGIKGDISTQSTNATVSRITFGLRIDPSTDQEKISARESAVARKRRSPYSKH